MEIRALTPHDADSYRRLRLEALEREPLAFTESPAEHQATTLDATRARLAASDTFVVGVFVDKQLVGMAGFFRRHEAKTSHRGHIWGVYISHEHRTKGLARAMLTELLRLAQLQAGIEQVTLAVSSDNIPARRLYQALGFQPYGREARALKIGDTYVDEDLMILYLPH